MAQVQLLALCASESGCSWLADMIVVAAYTGLRLNEVAELQARDILEPVDGAPWRVRVRRGKGGYEDEESVLFPLALEVLQRRAAATSSERERLFVTAVGTKVSRQTLAKRFKSVAAAAGFVGTFHALRHFHACWLIDAGAQVLDVSVQLRHHDGGDLVRRLYGRHFSRRAAHARIADLRG